MVDTSATEAVFGTTEALAALELARPTSVSFVIAAAGSFATSEVLGPLVVSLNLA
jgi:hypothetical protein